MIIGQTGVGFPQVGTLFALIGNDFDKSVKKQSTGSTNVGSSDVFLQKRYHCCNTLETPPHSKKCRA